MNAREAIEKSIRLPEKPSDNQIEAAIHHLPDMRPDQARKTLRAIYSTFIDMRPGSDYPTDLTPKMIQMMETIQEFQEENGYAPTQVELSRMFGVDRSSIRKRLLSLKRKGYLVVKRGHRGIVLKRNI